MTDNSDDASPSRADILKATSTMLSVPSSEAEQMARARGWLDEKGEPTDDGRAMLEALGDQKSTRSVYR